SASTRACGRFQGHQFQADGDRNTLINQSAPLKKELRALLLHGSQGKRQRRSWGLAKNLLKIWPALWTFTTVPGVEPTNNAAERALRPAVLWRKGSFGTQSEPGSQFVARMLSVAASCRQQRRSLLDYLTEVCAAAQRHQPI